MGYQEEFHFFDCYFNDVLEDLKPMIKSLFDEGYDEIQLKEIFENHISKTEYERFCQISGLKWYHIFKWFKDEENYTKGAFYNWHYMKYWSTVSDEDYENEDNKDNNNSNYDNNSNDNNDNSDDNDKYEEEHKVVLSTDMLFNEFKDNIYDMYLFLPMTITIKE